MNIAVSIACGLVSVVLSLAALRNAGRHRSWRFPATLLSLGWAIGNVSRLARPFLKVGPVHYDALVALVLLLLISIWLVFDASLEQPRTAMIRYCLNSIAFWASFVSGWSFVHGHAWDDLLGFSLVWCAGCCVVGGTAARIWSQRRHSTDDCGTATTIPPV